ncbi:ankyrin repeat-containing domain protein [Sphaerosporella brunnea]|uniref:Ankyrin repeat-containing domain protein n=1 Tax=Sphaerosporella brunnea TaxID=1250544 RepID=A0A5J5ETS0_9PEZI|nr:ankyrin repeat-containing domain protein [Sphaerosporella brunnea]
MPLQDFPVDLMRCVLDVLAEPVPSAFRPKGCPLPRPALSSYAYQCAVNETINFALTCRRFFAIAAPVLDKLVLNAAVASQNIGYPLDPSVLQWAARNNKLDLARRLLALGVDPNWQRGSCEYFGGQYGACYTPLTIATRSDDADMTLLLLTHGATPGQHGAPVLHLAAQHGWIEVIEKLCELGTDINLGTPPASPDYRQRPVCSGGTNALFFALQSSTVGTFKRLLELGADVHAKDHINGGSLLHHLRGPDDAVMVEFAARLLHAGVEVNGKTSDGLTPLHTVAMWGLVDTARLLLEKGAECTAADELGDTPLHLAVRMGKHRVLPVLIQGGGSLEAKNHAGKTPIDEACSRWASGSTIRSTVEQILAASRKEM